MHSRRGGSSSPRFLNKTHQGTHHHHHGPNQTKNGQARRPSPAGHSPEGTSAKNKANVDWKGYLFIFVISVAVYWNSLDGDFVHDDIVSVVRNPDVRPTTPWTNLWKNDYWGTAMSSPLSHKSYRPLTVLTFRVNFALNNRTAFWFHVTNILIHASVSIFVLVLCSGVLQMSFTAALTSSAIFALHPIHTEAVAGITGRSDALACLLMLGSFLLYSKSLVRNSLSNGLSWSLIGSGLLGCLAMLAKETGITIIAINTFYDLYLHMDLLKRWFVSKSEDACQSQLRRRVTLSLTLICFSLAIRLILLNGAFPRFSPQDNPAAYTQSNMSRYLTYAFLPVFNVWLLLCPYHLSYDWQMGSIPLVESLWDIRNLSTGIFYTLFFWLLLSCFTQAKSRSRSGRTVFLAILFICLPFLPASNLLFPVGFVAAERVLYTPSIGLSILTAHGFHCLQKRLGLRKNLGLLSSALLCLMLMSFTVKTMERNTVWKSRATLFESGLRENSKNAKVHYNYANLQKDLGNIEAAVKHYKRAISLWPDYASAHNNLGALSNNFTTAENCFLKAVNANSQHNGAHFNLAVIYMRNEKYEEALEHLEECLKLDPSHVEALQYLGMCYRVLNRTEEADNVFHKLISSDLPPSKVHTNFGLFLQELGRSSEALTHYVLALTTPSSSWNMKALAHGAQLASQLGSHQLFEQLSEQLLSLEFDSRVAYMLAINYMRQGRLLDAKLLFERLVHHSDSFYKIHYAQFLIDVRRWSEAERTLREILRVASNDSSSLLLLATVYENQNRTTDAFDTLHSSLDYFCPHDKNLCSVFYSQLGNLMHTTGAVGSAADYYDKAIKFNPNSIQAHTNIGAIYHLMNNYKQAQLHYLEALKIEPTNGVVRSNIQKLQRLELQRQRRESQQKTQQASQNDKDFSYAKR